MDLETAETWVREQLALERRFTDDDPAMTPSRLAQAMGTLLAELDRLRVAVDKRDALLRRADLILGDMNVELEQARAERDSLVAALSV